MSTEASTDSCVRLSLRYHSLAVLSEWHISLLSSCSSIFKPSLYFLFNAVMIHFQKSVADIALSGLIPDLTAKANTLLPMVSF